MQVQNMYSAEIYNIYDKSDGHIQFAMPETCHDDVIKWKHFPRYWPLMRGIHRGQRPVTRSFDVFFDLRLNINGWV